MTSKTDERVCAYGDVDELNCALGVLLAGHEFSPEVTSMLTLIQNELFDVGADLSNPVVDNPAWEPLRIIQPSIDRLEQWCDVYNEDLGSLRSFILPGGSTASAQMHLCRAMARRAERSAWMAADRYGVENTDDSHHGGVNPLAIKYLNRLSDLFFILARYFNMQAGIDDVLWRPGTDRDKPES